MNILQKFAAKLADLARLPMTLLARVALQEEPQNMSASATVSSVQSALRNAESGHTRELFALYRDLVMVDSHVLCEFSKRKLAVLAQPFNIQPADKDNAEDQRAAEACRTLIAQCENWSVGLNFLLDSTLWPVSVVEKLFAPSQEPGLRYLLRRLEPVNYTLLCFRPRTIDLNAPTSTAWEPDLRFYATDEAGRINWSMDSAYAPDPARHIVHRGHLFAGTRDNFGGPMRALLWWCFLTPHIRDWWARASERYGAPFPVGHTDIANAEAVALLQEAFAASVKIGGLIVDHETQVELIEAAVSGMADNFERFQAVCNREKSKVILGQELSATSASTGLGSGVAKLQGEVREDYRMYDQLTLAETLRSQLFAQFLRINGLTGAPPRIVWGGLDDADAKTFAELLELLARAGFEPTDEALPTLSERLGMEVQRKAAAPEQEPAAVPFRFGGGFDPNQPRNKIGEWTDTGRGGGGGGGGGGGRAGSGAAPLSRAERARLHYNPASKEKQRLGEANELKVAKAIGGKNLDDNEAFDVVKGRHAVEVKTIVGGKNPKITMHPESLARKVKQARREKLATHTVVIDARRKPPSYYYRQGLGSFRLSSMQPMKLSGLKSMFT